ncbi:hypothetical protein Hamer_G030698, partial [Homarus americanus]
KDDVHRSKQMVPLNELAGRRRDNLWAGKRENNSHIDCGCPREKKIPVLELEFIKAQRTKAEGQGSMQMGSIDYSETKKQIANAKKREQIREREQKKKMKSEEVIQREEELWERVCGLWSQMYDSSFFFTVANCLGTILTPPPLPDV